MKQTAIPNKIMFPKKKWIKSTRSQPHSDLRKQINKLDKVFSEFIRLRDADRQGICKCITCGRFFKWNEGDAGHYVQRDRLATRFNEKNVHAQCKYCNRFRSGEQYLHGIAINKKYGKGTAEKLILLSKIRKCKLDLYWLDMKVKEYRTKVKNLRRAS
jgi:hypothetical protein